MKNSLVQIYTGEGKGKTTAAAGLAIRAAGRGLKVVFIQFLKHDESGEVTLIERSVPEIEVLRFNSQSKFIWEMNEDERNLLRKETSEGFKSAADILKNGNCDMLILDEIFGACRNGFISEDEILKLINAENINERHAEIVLTGRDAPGKIIEAADLVTEMKKIKHPFDTGIKARIGIER